MSKQTPAAFVAQTADFAYNDRATPLQRAVAEWLNYTADVWDRTTPSHRDHALNVARKLRVSLLAAGGTNTTVEGAQP